MLEYDRYVIFQHVWEKYLEDHLTNSYDDYDIRYININRYHIECAIQKSSFRCLQHMINVFEKKKSIAKSNDFTDLFEQYYVNKLMHYNMSDDIVKFLLNTKSFTSYKYLWPFKFILYNDIRMLNYVMENINFDTIHFPILIESSDLTFVERKHLGHFSKNELYVLYLKSALYKSSFCNYEVLTIFKNYIPYFNKFLNINHDIRANIISSDNTIDKSCIRYLLENNVKFSIDDIRNYIESIRCVNPSDLEQRYVSDIINNIKGDGLETISFEDNWQELLVLIVKRYMSSYANLYISIFNIIVAKLNNKKLPHIYFQQICRMCAANYQINLLDIMFHYEDIYANTIIQRAILNGCMELTNREHVKTLITRCFDLYKFKKSLANSRCLTQMPDFDMFKELHRTNHIRLYSAMFVTDNIDVINYLFEQNYSPSKLILCRMFKHVCQTKNLTCLKYLHRQRNCVFDPVSSYISACQADNVYFFQYLLKEMNYPVDPCVFKYTIGNYTLLKYWFDNNLPIHSRDLILLSNRYLNQEEPNIYIIRRHKKQRIDDQKIIIDYLASLCSFYTPIKENDSIDCCPICLEECKNPIKVDNCNHLFCKQCIDKWYYMNNKTCPFCRREVTYSIKYSNIIVDI